MSQMLVPTSSGVGWMADQMCDQEHLTFIVLFSTLTRMRICETINEPIPFQGTEEEAQANFATHHWWQDPDDWEMMCDNCGHKAWHKGASYPCGTEVPRRDVIVWFDAEGERHRNHPTLASLGIAGDETHG